MFIYIYFQNIIELSYMLRNTFKNQTPTLHIFLFHLNVYF